MSQCHFRDSAVHPTVIYPVKLLRVIVNLFKGKEMPTYHRMANGEESTEIKYQRMKNPTGDGYTALQFKKKPVKIPWRSITVAIVLFILGSSLLCVGALFLTGHIPVKYNDRFWPILILGVILFIPGFYHVRLAFYAYKGYKGYSFEDIPDYED